MKTSKSLDKFLKDTFDDLPDILEQKQLIETGLFQSYGALSMLRLRNKGPNYMRIGGRYKYFKEEVIEWLKANYHAIN